MNQLVIEELKTLQFDILRSTPDAADKIAQFALDTYSERLRLQYFDEDYRVHSLSSFILRNERPGGGSAMVVFPELVHIGELCSIGYSRNLDKDTRVLYVGLDAKAIARPPADTEDFEAFVDHVSVPVLAVKKIWPAA